MPVNPVFYITLFLLTAIGYSQELYQPRDIKQAYENKTRSMSGEPGEDYWQNTGIYDIKLTVNPPDRTIYGTEKITYTNNSPDTLKALNFKLYLNQHRPGAARLSPAGEDYFTSGTYIDSYSENGTKQEWPENSTGTNKKVKLEKALAPGAKVNLAFDWHFDMSKQSGREGAIDETTFFIAYFYPRVAVYDDYAGWDTMTFTGSQEFYNDFNDYTVEVNVPKNYIVWATGDLLNPDELLQKKYADKLKESMTSDSIIRIATPEDLSCLPAGTARKQITKQDSTNTWKWKTDDITDVAIAVSDHYNWDAGSVVVDRNTGRRASVQSAYDEQSTDFKKMVGFGRHALDWFSNNYPGVPYPFSKMTVVRGYADMEYPMMANDSSHEDEDFTRFVAEHEIAHTYFPFYMGTNETRFGFMDEGWATTLEYLIGIADLGQETATKNYKQFRVARWARDNSMEGDIPTITPSNMLSGPGLGINEYGKASLGYLALKDLLGDDAFKTALQGYMARWNGKHPMPWDFFYSINDISGKDLNWFWNAWFFSNNYIDLAIKNVKSESGKTTVELENIGGMPVPVDIIVTSKDGSSNTFHQTPEIWKDNNKTVTIELDGVSDVASIVLDGGIFMDADTSDDVWGKTGK